MNTDLPPGGRAFGRTSDPVPLPNLHISRLDVDGLDGSHMGLAVNWWQAQVSGDPSTVETIKAVAPPIEALRSALEVIFSLVDWIARNDHASDGDGGQQTLTRLSQDPMLPPSLRLLCRDLSAALLLDPAPNRVLIHPVDVSSVMGLLVHLSEAIRFRFGVLPQDQIDTYRRAVLAAEDERA